MDTDGVAPLQCVFIPHRGAPMIDAPFVTIVVMAYNEEVGLRPTIERTVNLFQADGRTFEVLVIDDGSTDATAAIADQMASADARIRVIHHTPNLGLGAVWRHGLEESRGDWVTFLPADGQIPPETAQVLLARAGEADLVLGTLPAMERSLTARVLSAGERALIKLAFGAFPRFQGGLAVNRKVLEAVPIAMPAARGWMIVTELILRARDAGFRMVSVPTKLAPRLGGVSKVNNLKTVAANLRQLGELRLALWGLHGDAKPLRTTTS